jgi:hypothetical protein
MHGRRQLERGAHQRFAERQVDVHRPGVCPDGAEPPVGGEVAPLVCSGEVSDAWVRVPPHHPAVQLGLVDGLRCADALQLRRAIGGEHEHRHAREVGLHHGGVKVGGGSAAGAQQRRGHSGGQPDAERDERRTALIVHHLQRKVVTGGQCQRHGRAARTGCHHCVPQAEVHPLVDQGGAERGLHVGRSCLLRHAGHDTGLSLRHAPFADG